MPIDRHDVRGLSQAGRHDPRLEPHQPVRGRGRRPREHPADARRERHRRDHRDRRRGHAHRGPPPARRGAASRSSACRRPSTTTSRPPTTRSASTPRSRSRPRRSTACAPPPSRTAAAWCVEVMGRHVGWIALHSGMAGGAHAILIPEQPQSIEQICEWVESVRDRGRAPLVVVAEGFHARRHGRGALAQGPRRVQPPAPRRHRRAARADDRGAHRHRVARDRARPHPARRRADARTTACSRRASAWPRSTPSTTARGARWSRCAAPTSRPSRSPTRVGSLNRVPQSRYDEAKILFG